MRLMRFLLPLLALGLIAAASKPKVTVRFHIEVDASSGDAFMMSAQTPDSPHPLTLSKTAEISESDILAIFPFPADDGTIGCAFRLDAHGQLVLDTLSSESRGAMLVGFVNGRAVTAMLIDRRISDGIITITRGLRPEEILLLRKAFPTLGAKKPTKSSRQSAAPAGVPAPAAATPPIPVPAPLPETTLPRGD